MPLNYFLNLRKANAIFTRGQANSAKKNVATPTITKKQPACGKNRASLPHTRQLVLKLLRTTPAAMRIFLKTGKEVRAIMRLSSTAESGKDKTGSPSESESAIRMRWSGLAQKKTRKSPEQKFLGTKNKRFKNIATNSVSESSLEKPGIADIPELSGLPPYAECKPVSGSFQWQPSL